jgi:F0F1-type ATP synthase membrane subunit c/vacuolar-type H+-ATPase subunit K
MNTINTNIYVGGVYLLKRFSQGLIAVTVGIAAAAYMGVIDGINNLTSLTVDSVARNPSLYPRLKEAFLHGITFELLIFLIVSVVITSLILLFPQNHNHSRTNFGFYAIGASISTLVAISYGSAAGSMAGAYIEAFARNPAAASLLKEILTIGNISAAVPFVVAIAITIHLLIAAFRFFKHLFVFEIPSEN